MFCKTDSIFRSKARLEIRLTRVNFFIYHHQKRLRNEFHSNSFASVTEHYPPFANSSKCELLRIQEPKYDCVNMLTSTRFKCKRCDKLVFSSSNPSKLCSSCERSLAFWKAHDLEKARSESWNLNPVTGIISWFFGRPTDNNVSARQIGYGQYYMREEYYQPGR